MKGLCPDASECSCSIFWRVSFAWTGKQVSLKHFLCEDIWRTNEKCWLWNSLTNSFSDSKRLCYWYKTDSVCFIEFNSRWGGKSSADGQQEGQGTQQGVEESRRRPRQDLLLDSTDCPCRHCYLLRAPVAEAINSRFSFALFGIFYPAPAGSGWWRASRLQNAIMVQMSHLTKRQHSFPLHAKAEKEWWQDVSLTRTQLNWPIS